MYSYWDVEHHNKNGVPLKSFQEKMILYGLAPNVLFLDRVIRQIKLTFNL